MRIGNLMRTICLTDFDSWCNASNFWQKSATLWLPSCLAVQLDCMVDWAGNSTAIFIVLKKGEHSDILLMCRPSLIRGHLLEFKSRTWWHRLYGNMKKLNCIDRRLKWGTLSLYTIRRWYNIINQKTRDDLTTIDGYSRPGFYRLAVGDS